MLDNEARVNAIINQELNWWNVPLIESIFPEHVAAQICGLAISPRSQQDRTIWAGTKNGRFTIQSA